MRKPPLKIRLGHRTITVKISSTHDDQFLVDASGYAVYETDTIVLRNTLSNGLARATLLHELIHIIVEAHKPNDSEPDTEKAEHWFIGIIENPLLSVLQDNPELTEYLLRND